ncbi:MAG: 30S ribosomal protein S12 methylthiotransferase RimO [Lachnospiraceae bacterium]|nr:30S ribosomal protein S12 methylthiotransferase RimO [Lachnospiraceae bacterium]
MKILFISLGCDKNLVDSENMLGLLREANYEITNDENEADVIVVNSCCFIHDAKEESIQTILEMAQLKETGNLKALIVAGCLAQRYRDEITKELPEVDAIIGTTGYENIVSIVQEVLNKSKDNSATSDGDKSKNTSGSTPESFKDINYLPKVSKRINTTGGYYSYLKIAEGCNKHCTYCIIPEIRGEYRSVPMELLLQEAKELADNGVKELILVAQETTIYGTDLYGERKLPELLHELAKIDGICWIRILYCYPEEIDIDLINAIKAEPKVLNYLDMPIQHCTDKILKKMGRRTSKQELVDKVHLLRENIPDITLRTTLITGFPGETEEDHEELKSFVKAMEFDRLGVFTYSPEEGTPAASFEPQIDEEVKVKRQEEIMLIQQKIAFDRAAKQPGRVLPVMIEGFLPDDQVYIGRTYMDAPNIDGFVFVSSERTYMSGDIVDVYITDSNEYDLIGEIIER